MNRRNEKPGKMEWVTKKKSQITGLELAAIAQALRLQQFAPLLPCDVGASATPLLSSRCCLAMGACHRRRCGRCRSCRAHRCVQHRRNAGGLTLLRQGLSRRSDLRCRELSLSHRGLLRWGLHCCQ